MTLKEKVIVETYTGYCMVTGEDREALYKYWAELMGRPVYTHNLASKEIQEELREKSKADFITLCQGKTGMTVIEWLTALNGAIDKALPVAEKHSCKCNKCDTYNSIWDARRLVVQNDIVYCWHCGQAHRLEG